MSEATVLERLTLPAGAALQFVDATDGQPVVDGLRCTLCRLADSAVLAESVSGPGGVHHWPDLPARWAAATEPPRAELQVQDARGRFLPLRLRWPPPPPLPPRPGAPAEPARITLCSAPARPAPAGMATLQALLVDEHDRPAAGALLLARSVHAPVDSGVLGMSDTAGRLVLHLPFPQPERRANGQPPAADQPWPVADLALFWRHDPALAAGHGTPGRLPAPRWDAWLAQPEVLAQAEAGHPAALATVRVEAGRPAVLRTAGLPPTRSELRLVPR